jgi:cytochrome c-type biogenesis protein CcmH/NrfG
VATKKQQRRRQKQHRHEYEEVYVDDEGRELDPEEAEQLVGEQPARKTKATKSQPAQRGGRTIDPPSWRRTFRRGALFFPLMLLTVMLLGRDLSLAAQIGQTVVLMAFFLPFSYFMDSMVWRSHQRRLAKQASADPKKR